METANIRIGELPAYQALPSEGGPFPIVLVVLEIFGVNDYIERICRSLADLGYYAIAPELYFRQGDPTKFKDHREIIRQIVSKVPDQQVMADLDAAMDYAAASGRGDPARVGLTGFCWGGRIAWLHAAHSARLTASVAWYGRLVGDADPLHPQHPIDLVGQLKCPVLGLYGGKDESIPIATVEWMREAILQARKDCEIVVYPEAGHAFHADYRPSYNQAAAEDGWRRMLQWFRQYGVA